jgi:acyl-CoA dehydrogenase
MLAHWFAETELRPVALKADQEHDYPESVLKKMVEYGIGVRSDSPKSGPGATASDDDGPSTLNRAYVLGAEELSWGDPSSLLCAPGPGLGGPPVRIMGTQEQQERYFAVFKDKEKIHYGAYGLTEPGCGTDVSNIQTTAVKDGNEWVLNGTKCFITNGARADWVIIFATVDKEAGRAGHRAFVVEKGTPGFKVGKIEEKMGLRASETAELVLEDCRVPEDNLLGGQKYYDERGKGGFSGAMKTFDSTRPAVGAMATGIARACYEIARDFVKENYVINRPIPRYELIREGLSSMNRRINAARLLCWQAAFMADMKQPNTKEASMAKGYAGDVATEICSEALQLMGGTGTTQEALVEKFFRDIKVYDIFEGTAQAQRIVISKRIVEGITRF